MRRIYSIIGTILRHVEMARAEVRKYPFGVPCVFLGGLAFYFHQKNQKMQRLQTLAEVKRRSTEKRFLRFASTMYDGQIYMTPLDFIESLLDVDPRKRMNRRLLQNKDLEEFYQNTPAQKEGSKHFFRHLNEKGIISYSEYLFLLSVLIKPASAFRICFNMLDTDNSDTIDKDEYLVMERIFSKDWKQKRRITAIEGGSSTDKQLVDDEDGLQRRHSVDTTLMVHFFGRLGDLQLDYYTFEQFMIDFQDEILELEFAQFSHGLEVITQVDFAKIILRYTYLDSHKYEPYLERLLERIEAEPSADAAQGINLKEFKVFVSFLNNLNDFMLAMKFYTQLNTRVTPYEFQKAVRVCTGHELSLHLIRTLFNIFDANGDGMLSYREFIFIMEDRLRRGFRKLSDQNTWESFKTCIRHSMFNNIPESLYY